MKITCVQENLNKALMGASRIISVKSSLPILDNILLSSDQGRLKVSATDLELGINYWIGAKIEDDGSIAAPSRLISEFISNIREEKVTISTSDQNILVEGNKYKAEIKGVNSDDYPSIPDISDKVIFSISVKELSESIPQVVFSAAQDNTRPVLGGVYIKLEKNSIKMVATDSYRLSEKSIKIDKKDGIKEESFIIPTRTIIEVSKLLKDTSSDKVNICFDGNQILFDFGSIHLVSRLIDGQYPNYKQIIPDDFQNTTIVSKSELQNICKVASLFSKESANSVKVSAKPNKDDNKKGVLSIVGQGNQTGESVNEIDVKMEGKEVETSFNAKYILDVLINIPEKNVEIKFSGQITASVIKGEGNKDYTYVIMPLRN